MGNTAFDRAINFGVTAHLEGGRCCALFCMRCFTVSNIDSPNRGDAFHHAVKGRP
jgi:hypothetical protein